MSLRFRLIGLVAIAFVTSMAVGGVIISLIASRSVRTEMDAALLVGRQAVENAKGDLRSSRDPQRDLESFVASFAGSRHLRVSLAGNVAVVTPPVEERSPFGQTPAWFANLIGVAPVAERMAVAIAGHPSQTVVIETDPRNEILEVWNEFCEGLIVLMLFWSQTILLIHLFTGRALRPLDRMAVALEKVGRGEYGTRIAGRLAPELSRLRDAFNRMTEQLAEMQAGNRRLREQMLTLQEQERRDLARDLHDEVSPFLFAIKVDIANVSRLAKQGRTKEISGPIQSITEAVGHMQRQVRSMLGRLRPIGLAEFGLAEAIGNIVEFWRKRNPEIDYRVAISPESESLGSVVDVTIYRIVQECVSNAVRHAGARVISVSIMHSRNDAQGSEEAIVEVADDGRGMREPLDMGFGLLGMQERIKDAGGSLTFAHRVGGGLAVIAALPLPLRYQPDAPSVRANAQ
jgi:two-component system sensor histidine kinase UhpB